MRDEWIVLILLIGLSIIVIMCYYEASSSATAFAESNCTVYVITKDATKVTSTTAIMNGFVEVENYSAGWVISVWFEYGETPSCENSTDWVSVDYSRSVSWPLENLRSNTTYYFKLCGPCNAGEIKRFRTIGDEPSVPQEQIGKRDMIVGVCLTFLIVGVLMMFLRMRRRK